MKKLTLALVLFIFVFTPILSSPVYSSSLSLVDGNGSFLSEIQVINRDDGMLLDLYNFFRAIDFNVRWDRQNRRLEVEDAEASFRFVPDSERVLTGDGDLYLTGTPFFDRGRLYLPADKTAGLLNSFTNLSLIFNPDRGQLQLGAASKAHAAEEDPIGRFLEDIPTTAEGEMLVIIDPGHGGRDPGAIGPGGLREKDVVLKISLLLRDYIEENESRIKVVLTRDEDLFIPLQDRTRIANEHEADVFISIHANSGPSSRASGFEVFTLSSEASDPSAQERADIENSVLRYEGYDSEELNDVSWILGQLRATVHTMESLSFAEMVVNEFENNLSVPNRGIKQAPFWVLKDARMPAVLVEAGFLSNPREEQRLRSESYQRSVVKSITEALRQYRDERF